MKIAFSLDTVNRSYQEPNLNRTALKFYWDELFKLVGAGGFDAIEMPFSAMPKVRSWDPFSKAQLEARYGGAEPFAKQLKEAGISKVAGLFFTPSVGGPFGSASVASADGFVGGMKTHSGEASRLCGRTGMRVCDHLRQSGGQLDGRTAGEGRGSAG